MKVKRLLALGLLGVAAPALAANVAVIDSGVDFKHTELSPRIWKNPGEVAGNQKDDDGNGYVDDVYGWNFAESNGDVIDYKYLGTFSADCTKYFEVQGRVLLGTATDADKQWLAQKKADETFLKELQKFGNFVHGTHVSGIASTSRTTERLIAVKIIPTETPGLGTGLPELRADDPLSTILVQLMLNQVVERQAKLLDDAGAYVAKEAADVANGSFGASYATAAPVVKQLLQTLLGREPTDDEVEKHTKYLLEQMLAKSKEFVGKAPDTLFVFASGNDGASNDEMPASPANVNAANSISVGATLGLQKLATFSNYGQAVDVAAPGVVIRSTIPGDGWLEMSGTSMAAPYVTEVAALVKDANPKLKPADIKRLLMETVDRKDFLQGKVKSGGIVNPARAIEAAKLARTEPLSQAVSQANGEVPDQVDPRGFQPDADDSDVYVTPLPSLLTAARP